MLALWDETAPPAGATATIAQLLALRQARAMCNLYRITSNVEAMRRLFAVTGPAPNLPLFDEIYPKREAPIIRGNEAGERRIEAGSWGIVGPAAAKGPVTNIRNLASPFWRSALANPLRPSIGGSSNRHNSRTADERALQNLQGGIHPFQTLQPSYQAQSQRQLWGR